MYQRNLGRNSLSESIVSDRSAEKDKSSSRRTRTNSVDSLGQSAASTSSGSMSVRSRENGHTANYVDNKKSLRESVNKVDYQTMEDQEDFQEISASRRIDDDDDDEVSDVDSIEDAQECQRVTTTQVQIHASRATALEFDDDETAMLQSEIPNDPVVTAYLEQASHICQNNCVKSMVQFNARSVQDEGISVEDEDAIVPNGGSLQQMPVSGGSVKNRRTSLSSGSVGRMETIVEEPIEAKVSVKEILARFETLRESAEVNAMHRVVWLAYLVLGGGCRGTVWAGITVDRLLWSIAKWGCRVWLLGQHS